MILCICIYVTIKLIIFFVCSVKDHLRLRLIDSGWNDKLNQLIQSAIIKRTENGQTANTIKFEELYKDVVDDARGESFVISIILKNNFF